MIYNESSCLRIFLASCFLMLMVNKKNSFPSFHKWYSSADASSGYMKILMEITKAENRDYWMSTNLTIKIISWYVTWQSFFPISLLYTYNLVVVAFVLETFPVPNDQRKFWLFRRRSIAVDKRKKIKKFMAWSSIFVRVLTLEIVKCLRLMKLISN